MIKPLKITCNLVSSFCGDSLQLDSLLSYELSFLMGLSGKVTRDIPLDGSENVPIPISKKEIGETFVWCCSNPIFDVRNVESIRYTKRFPSDDALLLKENHKKNLMTASGPYKMQYRPLLVFNVSKIVWFANGDKKEINRLLKRITAIGKNRNMGFGKVESWNIEESEQDYSILANSYLMRIMPKDFVEGKDLKGYRLSYGGYKPPYWHPDNYDEIAIPC
jgi:CRISPR type IV-associated protein Csf3